ncbi:MAG: DUF2511 domain-containing protein [Chryseolinea sp.]
MRFLILIVSVTFFGCGGNSKTKEISKADYGTDWPVSVEEGTVKCIDGTYVVFETMGKVYAVNDSAKKESVMKEHGWSDIEEIRVDDPASPDTKVNITPILSTGLILCK